MIYLHIHLSLIELRQSSYLKRFCNNSTNTIIDWEILSASFGNNRRMKVCVLASGSKGNSTLIRTTVNIQGPNDWYTDDDYYFI